MKKMIALVAFGIASAGQATLATGVEPQPPSSAAASQDPISRADLRVIRVFTPGGTSKKKAARPRAGLGDRIRVEISGLGALLKQDSAFDPRRLVLYVNGREVKQAYADLVDADSGVVEFELARTDSSRALWASLLGRPRQSTRQVAVSVGEEGEHAFEVQSRRQPVLMDLVVFQPTLLLVCLALMVVLVAGFIWLARSSNIIRDSGPPKPPPGESKPYSLARLQMAIWFFVVVTSFLFLWAITGSAETITNQVLILIGISTGTTLGAAVIDLNRRGEAESQLGKLVPERDKLAAEITAMELQQPAGAPVPPALAERRAQLQDLNRKITAAEELETRPVSERFDKDILTDANGISFHRFQMLVWTVVLVIVFIVAVYRTLAMPTFDATLLALLGISSGTYLGFKIPERQA
jgi:hypothetical protein